MKEIYTNNKDINLFLNRAQNKIAQLSTELVEVGGNDTKLIISILELSDFIECLDSKYCEWEEVDITRWIHEYNYRYNLNSLPFIDITGFTTIILSGGSTIGLPITTNDISDYIVATNQLIRATPHNTLSMLQGGSTTERYHITKEMYDFLDNLVNPKVPSTVSLQLGTVSVWPSGYFELGSSLSSINLIGSIQYNYYKQASYFEYRKNNNLLGSRITSPRKLEQPNTYTDTDIVKTDTTYYFNAMFTDGLKSSSRNIIFRQPMYYGTIRKNTSSDELVNKLILGTKDVRDKGEMTLSFIIPDENTLITDDSYIIPYVFVPFTWGRFSSAFNGIFDFANDWTSSKVSMKLVDNTLVDGLLLLYPTQIEGVATFKFNW